MKTSSQQSQGTKVTLKEVMADPKKPLKHFNPHFKRLNALVQIAQIEADLMDEGKADSIEVFMYEGGEWGCLTLKSEEGIEWGIDEYVAEVDFAGRSNRDVINQIRGCIKCSRGASERRYRETVRGAVANAIASRPEQTSAILSWASLM